MLPNLLIIGAQKAGTSSLHSYLRLHPDIQMSRAKELNFFAGGLAWQRGLDWYGSWFEGSEPIHGESSTSYTMFPFVRGVPERIHSVIPRLRLIYVVRDPVERIISEYLHHWARGREPRSLAEVVSDPGFPDSRYVETSRYFKQIERYLEHFDRERLLIVLHEDLLEERHVVLARIFRFLEVDDSFVSPEFAIEYNVSRDRRLHAALLRSVRRRLHRLPKLHALAHRVLLARRVEQIMSRELERPPLDPALRDRAAECLHSDVERLRQFTGLRLGSWSV
ncbi:MAG: sulfotransferase domain-containing protein [Thermoleophilaceae bacterium]|nr:sulfotransferase domain-containing protein [Thermoleophilaceae bacterium]